jgi:2,3-bisphosphoglycerate-independent phosphoglycerate mutase
METKRKAIMFIMDGLGDRPIKELGRLTPLEAARTPSFDSLASRGICGLMDPLAPGIRVGTDVGHLALFGYNPLRVYWGRGPIEAAGVGIQLEPRDVALRCNFATVDNNGIIVDRRAGRIRHGTQLLAEALNGMPLDDDVEMIFKEATEHRAVLVLRGKELSAEITNSDPGAGREGEPVQPVRARRPGVTLAERTAGIVNRFVDTSHEVLKKHLVNRERLQHGLPPANILITRGAGMAVRMRSLADRFHIVGGCVVGESTVKGIALMSGFRIYTSPSLTANVDTDLDEKARLTIEALGDCNFVVVHVKGADIASHDNDPRGKIEFLEKVDSMVGNILATIEYPEQTYIGLTADHATPCAIREHSGDPVPVVISGDDVLVDNVERYGERDCARGGLLRINANEFLLTLLDFIGVTYRFGA